MPTVGDVTQNHLCHSCGACAAACPTGAISFQETVGGLLLPSVDPERCTECGLCFKICPGKGFAPSVAESLPSDPFVGEIKGCFIGRATERAIYENAQSGGVATALLCYGLQKGEFEGVLVTEMKWGTPPRPSAYLATTIDEVVRAQKSKYAPVAALSALRKVRNVNGPIAVVGLPCQIHGLRSLMHVDSELRARVKFVIGLVCDRTMTFAAIDYLAKQALRNTEILMLAYRDKKAGGYPGNVRIVDTEKREYVLPASARLQIKDWFTPARCRICFDKLNVLSDITLGDPWGIEEADHQQGDSVILVRTKVGMEFIQRALEAGAIVVQQIAERAVLSGQKIDQKRTEWEGYMRAWHFLGFKLPDYNCPRLNVTDDLEPPSRLYIRKLRWSLSLDRYHSRATLLRAVRMRVIFQKALRLPRILFRRGVILLRKLKCWR